MIADTPETQSNQPPVQIPRQTPLESPTTPSNGSQGGQLGDHGI